MPNFIPLVKSSHLHPFISTFEHIGVPLERSLEYVGLNPDTVFEGKAFVPEYAVWHLLEHVSHTQGIENLGSHISEQYALNSYGDFGEHLSNAPNLYVALQRLIHDLQAHSNYQNYWLQENGRYIELCRIGTPGINVGRHQIEQHIMVFFIALVRGYLGENWLPDYLKVQSRSNIGVRLSPVLSNVHLSYSHAFGVLPMRKEQLLNSSSKAETTLFAKQRNKDHPEPSIQSQLQTLLNQNVFHSDGSIKCVSSALGLSERQLQRELAVLGTTFRELTGNAIRLRAKEMLSEVDRPIQCIASDLGYNNPKNFSRAFRALTGLSPSEYRQIVRGAQ
ncbi:AraC family transcriptional regulator [uncultured Vibrio sp.]|uniref:AraC family transcriptional regulator n=1 Tax=uncultured Vibrio sp. TaxID=114054 RepID=UPI0025EA28F3|nr:AraC family transcriptional regulator [uncultured Vibrio sp.]